MTKIKLKYQKLVQKIVQRADKLMSRIKSKTPRELTNQDIDYALFRTGMLQNKAHITHNEEKNLSEVAKWFEYLYELEDGKLITEIWRLKFYQGMTIRDIADVMDLPYSSVQRKLIFSYQYIRDRVSDALLLHDTHRDLDGDRD